MATDPLWRGTARDLAETYDGPPAVSLLEPDTEVVVITAEQYGSLVEATQEPADVAGAIHVNYDTGPPASAVNQTAIAEAYQLGRHHGWQGR